MTILSITNMTSETMCGTIGLCVILLAIVWMVYGFCEESNKVWIRVFCSVITAISLVCSILIISLSVLNTKYQYKVTLDEKTSVVELQEEYKIVAQEGSIYTIERLTP